MTELPQEPFRLGRVIGRSFSIWGRNLVLLFALVLVVSIPRILWVVHWTLAPPDPPPPPDDPSEAMTLPLARLLLLVTAEGLLRSLFMYLSQAVVTQDDIAYPEGGQEWPS